MATRSDAPAGELAGLESIVDALPRGAGQTGGAPRVVTSESLLAGATQLAILHDHTTYFLRQTRYGKLILTK